MTDGDCSLEHGLEELQRRRQTIASAWQQIDQERQRLVRSQQQLHWQQIIDHAEGFRKRLGDNLEVLSFAERQEVVQCLIRRVVVTGEPVDIYYALPFVGLPQSRPASTAGVEGTPGDFYRLRLAHREVLWEHQRKSAARCLLRKAGRHLPRIHCSRYRGGVLSLITVPSASPQEFLCNWLPVGILGL
jgi:hypothetical protein